jgi:hypothetical protein
VAPGSSRQHSTMDSEPIVFRGEAVGLMFAVADILEEVKAIRELLEEDDGEEEEPAE